MGPTESIFDMNLTIYHTYLCTKFGVNRIAIATSSVDTYKHTRTHMHTYTDTHTENLSSRVIGGEILLPVLWDLEMAAKSWFSRM